MGLFGKIKEDKEYKKRRKEIKSQVDELMSEYDNEEVDGATYIQKMLDLASSSKKR